MLVLNLPCFSRLTSILRALRIALFRNPYFPMLPKKEGTWHRTFQETHACLPFSTGLNRVLVFCLLYSFPAMSCQPSVFIATLPCQPKANERSFIPCDGLLTCLFLGISRLHLQSTRFTPQYPQPRIVFTAAVTSVHSPNLSRICN